jgi:hypothetical protein
LYDGNGKDGSTFLMGLIDVEKLMKKDAYDTNRSGEKGDLSGSGRPLVGGVSGGGRVVQKALDNSDLPTLAAKMEKNAYTGLEKSDPSCRNHAIVSESEATKQKKGPAAPAYKGMDFSHSRKGEFY